jgi:ABC-type Fe3+-hydroxamate transport system substrate-binding protein
MAWGVVPVAVTRFCEQPGLPAVGGTKNPDVGAIVALDPDLVVLDDDENRREDAEALAGHGLTLHVTHVRSVADVAPALTALAAAVGVTAPEGQPPIPATPVRRRGFVPIWRRPWMTVNADTYGSSLLAAVGVDNVFAGAPDRFPTVDLEAAAACRPTTVLAPSEPYPFGPRHVEELRAVAPDVRLVDGKDLFWWGVRTPAAMRRLAQSLTAS